MSSRWFTARKRKRVRAVDPYLGFYPQSDPPSEAAQEQQPGMASTQPVLDPIQAQDSIHGAAQDASSSIMVSSERVSCSPKQPRPPKHTYAARKRRRIESDNEDEPSDNGEIEDVFYSSSSDAPLSPRHRIQSTKPSEAAKENTRVKLHKPKPVRGPFATRLIEKSLATGTRLADDLQALNDSTVPQLQLAEKPRARATFAASFVSRRTHRADIPTYSFPPRRLSMNFEDEPGDNAYDRGVEKRRPTRPLRLSQLRQPATKARKKAAPKELVFKPLTFQTVSSRTRTQPAKPPRREPVVPTAAATTQGVLRFRSVKSARRTVTKSSLSQTHPLTSSSTSRELPMTTAPVRYASSQHSDHGLGLHTGLDDCGSASLPPSDIVMPPPSSATRTRISQAILPKRAHKRTSAKSITSYSARTTSSANTQYTASLIQDLPIALHSHSMPPSTQILVQGTPDRSLARERSTTGSPSLHAAEYPSCFVPASISMLSSSPAAPLSSDAEQDAIQILVIDSSQVLTPDTQLSPASSLSQFRDDSPAVTQQAAQIFVPDSTQVIIPETSLPHSSHTAIKRTKFFKTAADLSDSVLDMIRNNAFAPRPFAPTY